MLSDKSYKILHSLGAIDEKGRVKGIEPIVYKYLFVSEFSAYNPYNDAYYERLKDAVAFKRKFVMTNANSYKYGEEYIFCIIYKHGGMTYSHHKSISYLERYIDEEEVANPLRKVYNYESIKDYIEDKSISDKEKIDFIDKILNEYSKIFDKRGRWEEYYH